MTVQIDQYESYNQMDIQLNSADCTNLGRKFLQHTQEFNIYMVFCVC